MAKIGLLGGTFDPIHYAHLFMGKLCADALGLEKVIFIPGGVAPHKAIVATDAQRRYEMTRLATADNPLLRCRTTKQRNRPRPTAWRRWSILKRAIRTTSWCLFSEKIRSTM